MLLFCLEVLYDKYNYIYVLFICQKYVIDVKNFIIGLMVKPIVFTCLVKNIINLVKNKNGFDKVGS